jgi:hypothetical protein
MGGRRCRGGLGVVAPGDVGPAVTLARAGAIDLLAADEAVDTTRASACQGP